MGQNVSRLLRDVKIPKMFRVKQIFPRNMVEPEKIPAVIHELLKADSFDSKIKEGMSIAVTAGSRGIANVDIITKSIVDFIKSKGAEPFIVPAMGSHGGASAQGQLEVLEGLGITQETMGCPIRSSMEVTAVGTAENGKEVVIDKNAAEADGIILSCRIKPHNSFRYRYESGMLKMMAVGLGKQTGAERCHEDGVPDLPLNIEMHAKVILEHVNILFAVASIENAYDETSRIVAVEPERILLEEPALLEEAKANMPGILVGESDVLIIDEIGKNYSGSGTDPNITGTFSTECASGGLKVQRTCMLDLSDASHGNAMGTGLASAITRRLFDKMDWDKMYPNCITSTVLKTAGIGLVMDNDKEAIQVCIRTCTGIDKDHVRIVRIPNSLRLEYIMLSEVYYDQVKNRADLEILSEPEEFLFNEKGELMTPIIETKGESACS